MARADTVFSNGTILTMDASDSVAEAVAVAGGRILAVGPWTEIEPLADQGTRRVDLAGRTMIPAFIDPHGHFPETGFCALHRVDLMGPPLGGCTKLADIFDRLAESAARTPKGDWVIGVFFDQTGMAENRFPTRDELDAVSRDHPVWVMHMSGHGGAGNGRALAFAGVDRDTPQPEGGYIEKHPETGEPTGLLEEPEAMGPIMARVFGTSGERFREGLRWACEEYAKHGLTTAQNAWVSREMLHEFEAAARDGDMAIRVNLLLDAHLEPAVASGALSLELPAGSPLRIGPRKLFSDGSIQICTAFLSKPYHTPFRGDAEHRGYPIYNREALTGYIVDLHKAGHQIHIHVNGDGAGDDVLHAFQAAQDACPRNDHRHTIIHGQTLREDQLDRMAELGITVSFFSYHVFVWGDRHRDIFLGPERARRISPAASAAARGIRFTIHNDPPVTPIRPLPLIWCAVNRLTASGQVLGEDQRISPLQALRAHTIDAAWQTFREDELGSIEPDKLADFAVLSANPLDDPEGIKDIDVEATITEGRTIYSRNGLGAGP
ncbi:MAG: amidohydrolase [Rhodospirillales bacterium]|nr:amidohydrolase [Rhodospirillales bacterium]MDH3911582.1 amidohydrolase [Rhodospirillales bacterium]MDH3968039.1 amidohydrolase [Rhodospirillales bacterium]